MGIIRAALNAIGGSLTDFWLKVIQPTAIDDTTCFVPNSLIMKNGIEVRKIR